MSKPPDSCARLAIVRIEVGKRPAPAIQMANVDELTAREPRRRGRPFAHPAAALDHLHAWLEHGIAAR